MQDWKNVVSENGTVFVQDVIIILSLINFISKCCTTKAIKKHENKDETTSQQDSHELALLSYLVNS